MNSIKSQKRIFALLTTVALIIFLIAFPLLVVQLSLYLHLGFWAGFCLFIGSLLGALSVLVLISSRQTIQQPSRYLTLLPNENLILNNPGSTGILAPRSSSLYSTSGSICCLTTNQLIVAQLRVFIPGLQNFVHLPLNSITCLSTIFCEVKVSPKRTLERRYEVIENYEPKLIKFQERNPQKLLVLHKFDGTRYVLLLDNKKDWLRQLKEILQSNHRREILEVRNDVWVIEARD
jgi:hypothetical protein